MSSLLAVNHDNASLAAARGQSTDALIKAGTERLFFKGASGVKSSNDNEYRVKPVFGFVESGGTPNVEITRLPGAAKSDKMVVHFGTCSADAPEAAAAFVAATSAGQVTMQITAA